MPQLALDLWSSSYTEMFQREFETSRARCGVGYTVPPSTYAARLSGEALEDYTRKQRQRERDAMANALHAGNQLVYTPSFMARSVVYVHKVSNMIQQTETFHRRLASKPTTFKFLRMMRDARPKPQWEVGRHVALYVADQTYEWVGMKKRGRRQAGERHDAQGMPMAITHEVYINTVKVHLPASLGDLAGVPAFFPLTCEAIPRMHPAQHRAVPNSHSCCHDQHRIPSSCFPFIVCHVLFELIFSTCCFTSAILQALIWQGLPATMVHHTRRTTVSCLYLYSPTL
jgi:hypothetical protein